MKDIHYDFVDLDSDASFELFGKSLGGVLQDGTLQLDNYIAKGELLKATPDEGLWIRKWKFTVFQKIMLHKLPPFTRQEKKFIILYFLNPAIFFLTSNRKKIHVNSPRNNMFFSSDVKIDFSVMPKQPFYVLDITFTASWLLDQFSDAHISFKNILDQYIDKNTGTILVEPCTMEEYKTLHELEVSMQADNVDILFIRSRVYNLIISFFSKVTNRNDASLVESTVNYEQMMQAENMITKNIKTPPKLETIARMVNMSVSSLLRQFKLIYGKSIYEYYVEKKMELAKKIILEDNMTIKETAKMFGYNQPSPFIECFTKYHGYSPGSLKLINY